MFETILVAHRGPLAVRVVRTVQRVGAKAVTVHSDVDDRALHVTTADESVLLGPADPARSYLDVDRVVEAARRTGAQAVHPGCGALAEAAGFAAAVRDAGLVWVGPDPSRVARSTGSRGRTGVTVLGSPDGGVVVGEHVVRSSGTAALDESGPPDESARAAAVRAAAGIAGLVTVELDGDVVRRLVPRLQAGHRVTELVHGVDLVEQQLLLAAGQPLSCRPGRGVGVAMGARVYAAGAGQLTAFEIPADVCVDVGYRKGDRVQPHYDPLLALVTAHGATREQALDALRAAVAAFVVRGVDTNLPALSAALERTS
ncbi:MAG: hypothetical protein H7323_02205 [Frankiales bacterium]|nr:hypothetical protein [Frankiales bacterium]